MDVIIQKSCISISTYNHTKCFVQCYTQIEYSVVYRIKTRKKPNFSWDSPIWWMLLDLYIYGRWNSIHLTVGLIFEFIAVLNVPLSIQFVFNFLVFFFLLCFFLCKLFKQKKRKSFVLWSFKLSQNSCNNRLFLGGKKLNRSLGLFTLLRWAHVFFFFSFSFQIYQQQSCKQEFLELKVVSRWTTH